MEPSGLANRCDKPLYQFSDYTLPGIFSAFIENLYLVGYRPAVTQGLEPQNLLQPLVFKTSSSRQPDSHRICGDDRSRTYTGLTAQGILSPPRLPISPHPQLYA